MLFDFNRGFVGLARQEFGVRIPDPDQQWPAKWDYLVDDGYLSRQQYRQLWDKIAKEPFGFWQSLPHYEWTSDLLQVGCKSKAQEVYFITSRCGPRRSSESTFAVADAIYMAFPEFPKACFDIMPTVIPVDEHLKKIPIINALGLTHYIDDRLDSLTAMAQECPHTKLALWDQPWNRGGSPNKFFHRVHCLKSVAEFKEWLQ